MSGGPSAILPGPGGLAVHRWCERCSKWVPKIGLHACAPRAKARPAEAVPDAVKKNAAPSPNELKASSNASSNQQAPSSNIALPASSNATTSRNARWRAKHPDQYRAIMREYMRKRRAVKAAPQSPAERSA